ncbi:MAG: hypothetical protein RL735_934 [Pseudomonadota bacterium]|jgi:hypothetical protein
MRCNFCDGTGMRRNGTQVVPCAECGGCGVAHCCDGIQSCCEIEGDERLAPLKQVELSPVPHSVPVERRD